MSNEYIAKKQEVQAAARSSNPSILLKKIADRFRKYNSDDGAVVKT